MEAAYTAFRIWPSWTVSRTTSWYLETPALTGYPQSGTSLATFAGRTFIALVVLLMPGGLPVSAEETTAGGEVRIVPTFHCLSVYWSPAGGGAGHEVNARYRAEGEEWRGGLPMRYHPIDSEKFEADYRSSIVNLMPGTDYEVELDLEGSDQRAGCWGTTWSEDFPVRSVEKISDRSTTLEVGKSGEPGAYTVCQKSVRFPGRVSYSMERESSARPGALSHHTGAG